MKSIINYIIENLSDKQVIKSTNDFMHFFKTHSEEQINNKTFNIKTNFSCVEVSAPYTDYALSLYMNDNSYGKYIVIHCFSTTINHKRVELTSKAENNIKLSCQEKNLNFRSVYEPDEHYTKMFLSFDKEISSDDILTLIKIIFNNIL